MPARRQLRTSHQSTTWARASAWLLATCLLLTATACAPGTPPPRAAATLVPEPADWYGIYFSDPGSPQAEDYRGGPAKALEQAIHAARLSVDVATFDLDLWGVRDALLAAHRRGVLVRLLTDRDNLETTEIVQLIEGGVPVVSDNRENLMHNKFVVIDRREVWTGSMNLTVNSAYRNNDNLVRIRSTDLADDYLAEFNEMFANRRFGENSPANTPHPQLVVQGTPLEVYFSPEDGVADQLIDLIGSAQESIYFLAYSFTSDDLADAILERARQGVTVGGVMEAQQVSSNTGGEYQRFTDAGLDVRLDGNPRNMHHKVLIIDGRTVVTGSYNFTANAERRNDENVLVVHNPQIAAQFLEEFHRLYDQANR